MFDFLFKKKRFKLDEPLTLLDKYYMDIEDRINNKEPYTISADGPGYLEYYRDSDADWTEEFSGVFDVEVYNFIEYIENEKYDNVIYKAGKIYCDKDEEFIDSILNEISNGKAPVKDSHGNIVMGWYWYNDKIQMCLQKKYDANPRHEHWRAVVSYRLLEPTPSKWYLDEQKKKRQENKDRIKSDIKKCLK